MRTAIVIGSGIVGLATARALAIRNYKVTVIDRSLQVTGASVRNFGMVWPIGQPDGELFNSAMLSRNIWKQICDDAGIWYEEAGSLHLAYEKDEWQVLEELYTHYKSRNYSLLNDKEIIAKSSPVVAKGLKGGLFSSDELIVNPRIVIRRIPDFLAGKYGVEFIFGKAVTSVSYPKVNSFDEVWEADEIYVCSGADFETLYPQLYAMLPLTKCKLQMMKMEAQDHRIGPALCGGLSLIHYQSFKAAPSLAALRQRYELQYAEYIRWGIHVMVSQHESGELTIGDSHEYGLNPEPFDKDLINSLILSYLKTFATFGKGKITENWHGIYPKLTDGSAYTILTPEEGVTIINGFGGAGMTLSFGVCEKLIQDRT